MGTRCLISVEGFCGAKIYKHYDGYPEATLPWLEKFNMDFTKNRGIDPTYKFAQLLRDSVRSEKEFKLDQSKYTGWGVVHYSEDCGQEYEYVLKHDGSVNFKKCLDKSDFM